MHDEDYEVRDSGKAAVYSDGMQRDDPGDKPRFDLLLPEGMPYEETLLYRTAMLYMRGGKKRGDRNWEKSSTQESLEAHKKALWRHFIKFAGGIEDGEDHAAAIVWNVQAVIYTQWRMRQQAEAVNSDHTVEQLTDKPRGGTERLQVYVFPVESSWSGGGRPYFNEITVKAPSYEAAKAELDKMRGRDREHSAEPDTQQPGVLNETAGPRDTDGWRERAAEIGGACPDGGACRHGCIEQTDWPCYRVLAGSPLSWVLPGGQWPPEIFREHHDAEASRLAAEWERNREA